MSKEKTDQQQFIFICNGKDCKKNGCKDIKKAIKKELKQTRKQKSITLISTKCTGKCKKAPVMIAREHWLTEMDVPKALELVKSLV